jgi:hypothetical protein
MQGALCMLLGFDHKNKKVDHFLLSLKIAVFGPFFKKIWTYILPTNNALKN